MMFYENDMMRILRESEKYNIMLLFASEEEALSAANNFRKAMTESIKDTRDKTVLQTAAGFYIYCKSIAKRSAIRPFISSYMKSWRRPGIRRTSMRCPAGR